MEEKENITLEEKMENINTELQANRHDLKKSINKANILKSDWMWVFLIMMSLGAGFSFNAPTTVGTIMLMIGIPSTIVTFIYGAIRYPMVERKIKELINKRDELTVSKDDLVDEFAIKEAKEIKVYSLEDMGLEEDLTVYEVSEKEFSEVQKKRLEYLKKLAEENPEEARRIATKDLLNAGAIPTDGELKSPYNDESKEKKLVLEERVPVKEAHKIINILLVAKDNLSLSTSNICRAIGISHTDLLMIENFEQSPSWDILIKYANYLGYELVIEKNGTLSCTPMPKQQPQMVKKLTRKPNDNKQD